MSVVKEIQFIVKTLTQDKLRQLGFVSQEEFEAQQAILQQQANKIKNLEQIISKMTKKDSA